MSSNKPPLIFECDATDSDHVYNSIKAVVRDANLNPHAVKIGRRNFRGADAVSLVQFTVDVSVHVDIAKTLWALAAVLVVCKTRVIRGSQIKKIESTEDIQEFLNMEPLSSKNGGKEDVSKGD